MTSFFFFDMNGKCDVTKLLEGLKTLKQTLASMDFHQQPDITKAFLCGPTGTGKTTFMHLMAKCNLKASKIPGNPDIVLNCPNCSIKKQLTIIPNFILVYHK